MLTDVSHGSIASSARFSYVRFAPIATLLGAADSCLTILIPGHSRLSCGPPPPAKRRATCRASWRAAAPSPARCTPPTRPSAPPPRPGRGCRFKRCCGREKRESACTLRRRWKIDRITRRSIFRSFPRQRESSDASAKQAPRRRGRAVDKNLARIRPLCRGRQNIARPACGICVYRCRPRSSTP
jgi:hypothetical protein